MHAIHSLTFGLFMHKFNQIFSVICMVVSGLAIVLIGVCSNSRRNFLDSLPRLYKLRVAFFSLVFFLLCPWLYSYCWGNWFFFLIHWVSILLKIFFLGYLKLHVHCSWLSYLFGKFRNSHNWPKLGICIF